MECFEALKVLKGIKGSGTVTYITKPLQAHFHDISDIGTACRFKGFEGIPMDEAMVTGISLGELVEASVAPVKVACVDDDTSNTGAVPTDKLGQTVHDNIGTMLDRSADGG